jgi:2-polyprenyl-3-methyl-5-hydroxy-6-metoxy-1,4-benzoquinol methylase
MDRLQSKLNEQYAQHYSRINASLDLSALTPRQLAALNLTYGTLIAALPSQGKVLDLGCGVGFLLGWLKNYSNITPFGVDSSPSQIEIARKNIPDIDVVCMDGIEYLRQHPATFDGIFCNDVVEHIPDDLLLDWLESVLSALKPGGFFTCRTPNAANLFSSYSRYIDMTHQRIFTSASILQLLEVCGFSNCRTLPVRTVGVAGVIRQQVDWLMHKSLFLITGRGLETVFTSNVIAVGYKPKA